MESANRSPRLASRDPTFTFKFASMGCPTLQSSVDEAVKSEIPTLILSAIRSDHACCYADQAAATLANSYEFIFPAGGLDRHWKVIVEWISTPS